MDPYLESPYWTNMHTQLSAEIARQLAPKVRPKYLVPIEERFVFDMPEGISVAPREAYPDVSLVAERPAFGDPSHSIAIAPIRLANRMPEKILHVSIEIRDTAERRLVTAIEVISPTNKRGTGRRQYLRRRSRILLSAAHLVEVDLLRAGRRIPLERPLPSAPYFAFVSRAEARPMCDIWPISLDSPLPQIPIPLLRGDADVPLDLQLALTAIYDLLGYDLAVNYNGPPTIPFDAEQEAWASELLRRAGLRK